MLLTFFEICLGIIFVVTCFVDYAWIYILFWIIIVLTIIDALIRARIYAKHIFRCKDCGKSFTMKRHKLFGALVRWKAPVEMKNGKETESNAYERAYIKCPKCGSDTCVLWPDSFE